MSTLPPLVAPDAELTRDEIARYSRHVILPALGMDGQRRLKTARVLVIGAGGLGSPALLYLAAAGVGTIGIVEFDDVEESNLQRQVIHGQSDIGRAKADSARDSILEINPHTRVELHRRRLEADHAVELFARYDLIVDGTDNFATRYLVNDAAVLAHKPYVWGSIYRFEGQASVFWEDAPDGRGLNYRDLYPQAPPPGTVPSCAEGGVLGVLCASIGSIMGTEAVKLICGVGESLLGRVMLYDALEMEYRTVRIRKDPDAQPVTQLVDYDAFCGVGVEATSDGPSAHQPAAEDPVPGDLEISPAELHRRLDAGEPIALIDVREPVEWDIVRIDGATLIPLGQFESGAASASIPADRPVVFYCRSGMRSADALAAAQRAGLADARHLRGGILAWARDVDPSLPVY